MVVVNGVFSRNFCSMLLLWNVGFQRFRVVSFTDFLSNFLLWNWRIKIRNVGLRAYFACVWVREKTTPAGSYMVSFLGKNQENTKERIDMDFGVGHWLIMISQHKHLRSTESVHKDKWQIGAWFPLLNSSLLVNSCCHFVTLKPWANQGNQDLPHVEPGPWEMLLWLNYMWQLATFSDQISETNNQINQHQSTNHQPSTVPVKKTMKHEIRTTLSTLNLRFPMCNGIKKPTESCWHWWNLCFGIGNIFHYNVFLFLFSGGLVCL